MALLGLQQDTIAGPPFGEFMAQIPHWGFIIIHSTLLLVALWLSTRVRRGGYPLVARGILLFAVAEVSYITYHAGVTHFLFAHTLAEVLDAVAFLLVGLSLARGPAVRS